MQKARVLILAAGKGTRMHSSLTKVLHKVSGKTMIEHVVEAFEFDEIERVGVVVAPHNIEHIRQQMKNRVDYILQEKQAGTAHAVLQAEKWMAGFDGPLIVVVGDAPLIDRTLMKDLLSEWCKGNFACLMLSSIYDNPPPYGRIIRGKDGLVKRIVEEKDATSEQRKIKEVSSSHYCFDSGAMFENLKSISNNNAQGEYYLTDLIEIMAQTKSGIQAIAVDPIKTFGINSPADLKKADDYLKSLRL